jgi:hypothetical protein
MRRHLNEVRKQLVHLLVTIVLPFAEEGFRSCGETGTRRSGDTVKTFICIARNMTKLAI